VHESGHLPTSWCTGESFAAFRCRGAEVRWNALRFVSTSLLYRSDARASLADELGWIRESERTQLRPNTGFGTGYSTATRGVRGMVRFGKGSSSRKMRGAVGPLRKRRKTTERVERHGAQLESESPEAGGGEYPHSFSPTQTARTVRVCLVRTSSEGDDASMGTVSKSEIGDTRRTVRVRQAADRGE